MTPAQNKEFKLRRNDLLKTLDDKSVVVIFSAKKCCENHPYHQNSDFYYLTGFTEPESIAVLIPGRQNGEFVLCSRERDLAKEIWDGPHAGQHGACKNYGADQALAISEANKILPKLIANRKNIYTNINTSGSFDPQITSWLTKTHNLIDVGKLLHEMRLIKTHSELKNIRKATEITVMGHLRAMKKCAPKMYEFELEAEILYEFTRRGGCHTAFPTIVAGGINACTLHYSKNNKKLISGELVLIDAGVEYKHYSADVSRTLPINGKFTRKQRIIYNAVLAAQTEAIKQIRPGVAWNDLQAAAERNITSGLMDAKLLRGNIDTLLTKQKFKPFFMHKVGHWLGLDTHDVGTYHINGMGRILEPGMILTIEPGLYIKPFGIGIRIEDNILVTKNGCEVLTAALPRNTTAIEKVMKK